MDDGDIKPWYETIDNPHAVLLARKLAVVFTGIQAEQMVLPYEPQRLRAPNTDIVVIRPDDLVPLWTCYLSAARAALQAQEEIAAEAGLGVAPQAEPQRKTPDQLWREGRGIETE